MSDINSFSYQGLLDVICKKNADVRNSVIISYSDFFVAEEELRVLSAQIPNDLLSHINAKLINNTIHVEYAPAHIDMASILTNTSQQIASPLTIKSDLAHIVQVGLCSRFQFQDTFNYQRNLDYNCDETYQEVICRNILDFFCSLGLNPANKNLIEYRKNGRFGIPILFEINDSYSASALQHVQFFDIDTAKRVVGFRRVSVRENPKNILINQKIQVNALEVCFISGVSSLRVHFSFKPEFFSNEDIDRLMSGIDRIVASRSPSINYETSNELGVLRNGDFLRIIYDNAASDFEKTIIQFSQDRYSWRDIITRSACIAVGLKKEKNNSKYCAIMSEPCVDFVCAALGIIMAGKTYVPVSKKFGKDRLLDIINGSNINNVITNSDDFLADEELGHFMKPIKDFYSNPIGWEEALNLFNFSYTNEILYRLHTSGSTGTPKAVDVSYTNYAALLESYDEFLPDFCFLNWAFTGSPVFDSSTKQYLFPLLNNTLVFLPGATIDENLALCCEEMVTSRVDVLNMTPALIKLAMDSGTDISSFRYILTGGEALSSELYQEILRKTGKNNLLNMYGPTEATVNSTGHIGRSDITFYESLPIGKHLKHSRTCVVDAELNILPMGYRGELLLSGALLTKGYPNDEAKTKEKFVFLNGSIWYKTGDQVVHWFDDNLYFIGRNDSQIKINGVRIELGEILSRLSKVSSVNIVEVTFRNNRIYVFFLPRDKRSINESDLYAEARTVLPQYVAIGKFIRIESIPLTIQGKTDKRALDKMVEALSGHAVAEQAVNITDKTELAIYEVISSVLMAKGIPWYQIDRSLLDQGVDSLTSLEILVQLERNVGLSASAKSIVTSDSLQKIKNILQDKRSYITSGWNQIENSELIVILFPPVLGDPSIFKQLETSLSSLDAAFVHCTYPGLTRLAERPGSISELAELIANEIDLSCSENARIIFLAYSMGCLVATETAQHLIGKRTIDNVILLDKGPYNSLINNTLVLQERDSLRFLRESIKDEAQINANLLSELEQYVKHNTNISFNYKPKRVVVETNALCVKCMEGGESFGNDDWRPFFSDFSIKQIECGHGQLVHGVWAEKVSELIFSHLNELVV